MFKYIFFNFEYFLQINHVAFYGTTNYTKTVAKRMRDPSCRFVIISPEKFLKNEEFSRDLGELAQRGLINRIIVDECHVILTWGSSFRKTLMESIEALDLMCRNNNVQIPKAYYTATLSERDVRKFEEMLHIRDLLRIVYMYLI